VNRGQDKRTLFYQEADYQHFIDLMGEGRRRYPVRIYSYNLIGNHFHQVLAPLELGAVSAYLQWVEGRYGCHLRQLTYTVGQGHVFQHRFWAEVIGTSPFHLFNVLRYVEANALAAGLVKRAEDWKWGSLWERVTKGRTLLDQLPMELIELPQDWVDIVNDLLAEPGTPGSDPYPVDAEDGAGSDPFIPKTSR
jgi:putative transposase